jgi:hypothetical protein
MKAKIVIEFHDKDDYRKVYQADSVVDFSADRFRELKALGLVVEVREPKPEAKKQTKA